MLMDGRSQTTGIRKPGQEATLLMVLNGYHDFVEFTLPGSPEGQGWHLLVDTNLPEQNDRHLFPFGLCRDWPIGIAVPPAKSGVIAFRECRLSRLVQRSCSNDCGVGRRLSHYLRNPPHRG
jgi:hypothetical protein